MKVLFRKLMCLMAEADAGGGGGAAPAAESVSVPAAAEPAPGGAAPAAPAAAPAAPDFTSDLASMRQELQGYQSWAKQVMEAQQKAQTEMQDVMLRTFAPEVHKQRTAPQYVTADQFQAWQERVQSDTRNEMYRRQFEGELALAKEKHADVFGIYSDDDIRTRWVNSKSNETVSQIAAGLAKEFERRVTAAQAALAAGKQATQTTVKGDGGAGRPVTAPPNGQNHNFRGRARLDALRKGLI